MCQVSAIAKSIAALVTVHDTREPLLPPFERSIWGFPATVAEPHSTGFIQPSDVRTVLFIVPPLNLDLASSVGHSDDIPMNQ